MVGSWSRVLNSQNFVVALKTLTWEEVEKSESDHVEKKEEVEKSVDHTLPMTDQ